MKLPRRDFLHLAGATAVASAVPRVASALDYPSRPIHWIIGFPPGGGADIGNKRGGCAANRGNRGHRAINQVGRHRRQPVSFETPPIDTR